MSNVRANGDALYTTPQLISIESASVMTGFVSLLASSLIIYFIYRNREVKLKQIYERIMLGASVMDVIVSSGFTIFGPWMIPREVDFVLGAKGSFATCSLSGFVLNFAAGALLYNAFLSIFFVLLIVGEIQEKSLASCFEPSFHLLAFAVPIVSGIYALTIDAMNPIEGLPGNCWYNVYPPICATQDELDQLIAAAAAADADADSVDEDELPPLCIRGVGYEMLSFVCGAALVGMTLITITVSMILIIVKVYRTELRLRNYSLSSLSRQRSSVTSADLLRTKQTCLKALLYIGSFVTSYFGVVGFQLLYVEDDVVENRRLLFAFAFLAKFFGPLQGLWHCIIYFKYQSADTRSDINGVFSSIRSSASSVMRSVRRVPVLTSRSQSQIEQHSECVDTASRHDQSQHERVSQRQEQRRPQLEPIISSRGNVEDSEAVNDDPDNTKEREELCENL